MRNLIIVITAIFIAGCSIGVELYPIEGKILTEHPTAVLKGTVYGVEGNTGKIEFLDENNSLCTGRWSSSSNASMTTSFFEGYAQANGLSVDDQRDKMNRGEAVVICPNGNRFIIEFYTRHGTANGYGMAKDSNENIYKVLF